MTKKEIINYMVMIAPEKIDNYTGEYNYTAIAERAAEFYNLYEDGDDYTIPEYVFDLAINAIDKLKSI